MSYIEKGDFVFCNFAGIMNTISEVLEATEEKIIIRDQLGKKTEINPEFVTRIPVYKPLPLHVVTAKKMIEIPLDK